MANLTHFDADGAAHMVDVSDKPDTAREAIAEGHITMAPETYALISEGRAKEGDVLGIARLAGIMGAKKTPDLFRCEFGVFVIGDEIVEAGGIEKVPPLQSCDHCIF